MTRYFNTALIAAALGACVFSAPATAEVTITCLAGTEYVAGTCVTKGLAASMTLRGTLMNQLKIGYNYPIPPNKDGSYPYNYGVNRFEFSQPGNFSTNPFPPSP